MPDSLATYQDLEEMWRPLEANEVDRAIGLIDRASALLRQVAPHVDARIARWQQNPADPAALDPLIVSTVVATIVKRFISNVEGIATQSMNGFAVSYALRTEKSVRGELQVTQEDLNQLQMYRPRNRIGSIRIHAAMAPSPLSGGGYYANSAILATGIYDSAWESELADLGYQAEGVFLEQVEGPM
jgi:hypothetical protein